MSEPARTSSHIPLSRNVRKLLKELKYFFKRMSGGYFSINQLDRKLEQYVNYDNGFYVELGANDGITQSNSLYFELKRHWRGILIEPVPHNYLLCRKNRGQSNDIFCNACVKFGYEEKYVDITYADLMTISDNLDLDLVDKHEHLKAGQRFLKDDHDIFRFGALAATLTSILDKANAPKTIDFMSLDVEGAELEVLQGLDFDTYSFKYLLIEVRNLEKIQMYLETFGYKLENRFSEHDYLFKKI